MKSWIEGEWRREHEDHLHQQRPVEEEKETPNYSDREGCTVQPLTWILCTLAGGFGLGLLLLSPIAFILFLFFIWVIFINPNGD